MYLLSSCSELPAPIINFMAFNMSKNPTNPSGIAQMLYQVPASLPDTPEETLCILVEYYFKFMGRSLYYHALKGKGIAYKMHFKGIHNIHIY